jgi:CRP-like cAMP-binding protein
MAATSLLRLEKLFANSRLVDHLESGDVVFAEGNAGSHMYVVLEGTVDVFVGDKRIDVLGPGDILGEMALISTKTRMATAVAGTEARLAKVDEKEFLSLVADTPFFALHVMRVLVERMHRSASRS